jgi:hypothetical protein
MAFRFGMKDGGFSPGFEAEGEVSADRCCPQRLTQ